MYIVPKSIQTRVVRMATKVKGCPYLLFILIRLLKNNFKCLVIKSTYLEILKQPKITIIKEVGTTLDLCCHPHHPCLYAFWYYIPTFSSFNPLRMRKRVTVVCLSVNALTARVLISAIQMWYGQNQHDT